MVLGVDESNVGHIVSFSELVVLDQLGKAVVGSQNHRADKVRQLAVAKVVQDTNDEDLRRLVTEQLEVGSVTLDEQLNNLLLKRLCEVLAVTLEQEVAQGRRDHDNLVQATACLHCPTELLVVNVLRNDVRQDLREGKRRV